MTTCEMTKEYAKMLGRSEVFVGLNDNDLARIATLPSINLRLYEKGEVVSEQGESAENLYILVEGQVNLRLNVQLGPEGPTKEIKVDTVNKGSIFGWSALVQPYAFSRTSVCIERSKVMEINGKELIAIMDSDDRIGYEIMRSIACVISSRLRTPNNYFWAELLKARNNIKH